MTFLFLILFSSFSLLHSNCPPTQTVKNEFIVKTNSKHTSSAHKLERSGVEFLKRIKTKSSNHHNSSKLTHGSETWLVKAKTKDQVTNTLSVQHIQENCYVELFSESTHLRSIDPMTVHQDWFYKQLNIIDSKDTDFTDSVRDVIVAVSDTGVDTEHQDLKNNIWVNQAELGGIEGEDDDNNGYIDDIYGFDVADQDSNPTPSTSDYYLDYDHGTHVAGLIAAEYNNGFGTKGLTFNRVKIMAIKGFRSKEGSKLSDLIESIYYAVDNGAQVVNLSWGIEKEPEQVEIDAINYALSKKVLVVAAAGNSSQPASWVSPASIPGVITVSSLNSDDKLSTFSNYGLSVDFLAPGGDGRERNNEYLLSTALNDYFIDLRGSSMSAPLVSGLIGYLMSLDESLTSFQALNALRLGSDKLNLTSYNDRDRRDYKKINMKASVKIVKSESTIEELDPKDLSKNLETEKELYSKALSSNVGASKSSGCGMINEKSMHAKKRAVSFSSLLSLMILMFPSFVLIIKRRKSI